MEAAAPPFGCRPFDVRNCFDTIWQASRRLADTVIENKDFEALIRQYDRDSAFFIAIRLTTKRKDTMRWCFGRKITNGSGIPLQSVRASGWSATMTVRLSGDLYDGYFITAVTRINNLAQRYEGGCEFPEVIITNYDPGERERLRPRQLDLFGIWGDGETDHYEIRAEVSPEREVL